MRRSSRAVFNREPKKLCACAIIKSRCAGSLSVFSAHRMNISFGSLIIRRLISRYRERAELIRAGGESRAHTEKKARFRHGGHAGCRGWGGGAGARGKYDLRRSIYLVGTDRASAEKMRYAELRGFLFIQRAAARRALPNPGSRG